MTVLEQFVLPADVVIAPVDALPAELRDRVDHEEGDCTVTRPRTRTQSSVVDAGTARLLERFRSPSTIVDAVIQYSAESGCDPRTTLEEAFGVLRGFVAEGLLVEAGSSLATPIESALASGDRVGGFALLEPVHLVADTEVHVARSPSGELAALKLVRPDAGPWLAGALAREAAVLERLDGQVTPRVLELGEHEGRAFLATEWCEGVDVHLAAAEARALGPAGRPTLIALGERVVAAYAHLHERGVLHGDVHPRNTIVRADGSVALIDFGLALDPQGPDGDAPVPRGGVDLFLDPESAAARRAGAASAQLNAAAEQYSVGALLYLLLTGEHAHAFSLEHEEMLRQLAEEAPLPFASRGVDDLPATEAAVMRALARDPAGRWPSTAALRQALRGAAESDGARAAATRRPVRSSSAARFLDTTVARLAAPGGLYREGIAAPTASAMNGGAGIAYALLRLAELRDDPELLAQADLWSTQAARAVGRHDAFFAEELDITPDIFGEHSFYHHAAGVHGVQALIAHARGDAAAGARALDAFLATLAPRCDHTDVTFGRAGLLLGCSLMLDALPPGFDARPLRARGDAIRDDFWSELALQPPLADRPPLGTLGAAHGWAGFLFGLLRWSQASGTPPPQGLEERLHQLAGQALPNGRGLRWPYEVALPVPRGGLEASWCNGAAGYVELWGLAHQLTGDDAYAQLAERAAWTAYEGGAEVGGDLCCGYAGRAYALLGLHRRYGDDVWVHRARLLAERAVDRVSTSGSLRRDSLYKGEVGVALLAAELEDPAGLGMPLFAG